MAMQQSIDRLEQAIQRLTLAVASQTQQETFLDRSIAILTGSISNLASAMLRQVQGNNPAPTSAAPLKPPADPQPQQVQTFADYIRQTQSLSGAIGSLVQALQRRNEDKGIKTSVPTSLLSGAAGEGYLANAARLAFAKGKSGENTAKNLRGRQQKRLERASDFDKAAADATSKAAQHRLNMKFPEEQAELQKAAQFTFKATQSRKIAGRLGEKAAAAEATGGVGMAGIGKFAGIVGLAASALTKFSDAVVGATSAQIDAMRKYEELSGPMAAVLAQRDVREMQRDIEKGNRLAGSAGELANSEQDREDNTKEIAILGDRMQNYFLSGANKLLDAAMAPLEVVSMGLNSVIDKLTALDSEAEEPVGMSDWIAQEAEKGAKSVKDNLYWISQHAEANRNGGSSSGDRGR